ncbi:DYN1 [Candida margitis]|uniref:DYN1 n=1 Tax=Candida margitis TaxID=1775924 RepID=UPI0022280CD6|nr:DYN1 [Candida margitis]KAI5950644.1 DYN1 [Candida margitis]
MAPSVEDPSSRQALYNHILDLVRIIDGESATIEDNNGCIQIFLDNHDSDTLLIINQKNQNHHRIYNSTTTIKPIINDIESIVFVIKPKGVLVSDRPFGSQLNLMKMPVTSEANTNELSIDALKMAVDFGLLPYFDLISSERGSSVTRKRLNDLSLALQNARSVQIPNLLITTHPKIKSIISGEVVVSQDLFDDIAFINELTAVSNDWINQIQTITKIAHSPSDSKSLGDEIQFWNTVELALASIDKQIKSNEVTTTLEVLSKARRFHVTLSFENDIGLKEMKSTAASYKGFFRDIPLDELLNDDDATYESFNYAVYGLFSHINQKLSLLAISTGVEIIQLLLVEISRKFQELVSKNEIMSLGYTSFINHQVIALKAIDSINDRLKLTTTVLREIARKRQEKVKPILIDKTELDSLASKLDKLTNFRANHENLLYSVENSLSSDEKAKCVKCLIEAYNKYVISINVIDVSHEGKLVWNMHENAYTQVFNSIFTSVVTKINTFFNTAESLSDYLNIFHQFFPNLDSANVTNQSFMTLQDNHKLKILDRAMLEIQWVREDLNASTCRGYEEIMRNLGLISKLEFYRETLNALLGTDWKNYSVGSKIDTLTNNLIASLDPEKVFVEWNSSDKIMDPRTMGVVIRYSKQGNDRYTLELNADLEKLQSYDKRLVLENLGFNTPSVLSIKKQTALYHMAVEIQNIITMINKVFDITSGESKSRIFDFISGDVYKLIPLTKQVSEIEWIHLSQAIDLVNQNDALLMRSESLIEMRALNGLQRLTQLLTHIDIQVTKVQNLFNFMAKCTYELKTVYFDYTQFSQILSKLQSKLDETILDGITAADSLVSMIRDEIQSVLYRRLHDQLTVFYNMIASETSEQSEHEEKYVPKFSSFPHMLVFDDGIIVSTPPLKDGRNHFLSIVNQFVAIVAKQDILIDASLKHAISMLDEVHNDSSNFILNLVTEKIDAIYTEVENYVNKWNTIQNLLDASLGEEKDWIFSGDDINNWFECLRDICEFGKVFDESRVVFGGLVRIEVKQVSSKMSVLYETCKRDLFVEFAAKFSHIIQTLGKQIANACKRLNKRINFDRDLRQFIIELGEIISVTNEVHEWESSILLFATIEKFMMRHRFKFPLDWLCTTQLESDLSKVQALLSEKRRLVEENRELVTSGVNSECIETNRSLHELIKEWEKARPVDGDLRPATALQCLSEYQHKLNDLYSYGKLLNEVAKDMGMEQPFTQDLSETMEDISHLKQVWSSVNILWEDLQSMKRTLWKNFDAQTVNSGLHKILQSIKELPFSIRQYSAVDELQEEVKNNLKVHPKLLQLSNSSLKERHWKKILDQLCPLQIVTELTLGAVWHLKIDLNLQLLQDILDQARDERTIEDSIGKIEEAWSSTYFELFNYENKCRLVKNWDVIFDQCEANLEIISSIKKSFYYDTFERKVSEWESKLNTLHAILDAWVDVQREWISLDGVLGKDNNEVRNLLPLEHSRFQNLSYEFVSLLKQIYKYDLVIDVVLIGDIQGQMSRFSASLMRIQRSLAEYLEKQRDLFPRFFFLGDEDLLEVIGFSKDITRINKHTKKMFGGVARINFDDASHSIISISSEEGETLALIEHVSLVKYSMLHEWLVELELQIQNSLRHQVGTNYASWSKFIETGAEDELLELLEMTPGQIANLLVQIIFTSLIEKAISSDMIGIGCRADQLIQFHTNLLKKCKQGISRMKIQNIIIELLQQQQLIRILQSASADNKRAIWAVQQRLYFEESTLDVVMKQAYSSFNYGFEYMGVPEKLAYSPLLNRCFLNMTQALSMQLGGSPVGPSGTGKTESVKALGQNLGKMVVVFCCDEQFDYSSMGRIFQGLCKVGVWGCFDEFNRLDEKSLSAISSQIETIQNGLQHPLESIELSDRFLHVNPETALFVTMNPGYAGRNELPENLKKLFRSFQMVKPDVQVIIQVLLTSMTFTLAQDLSTSIAQFFTEIESKVSNQKHYDFGLRAIKTTLSLCGKWKYRENTNLEDTKLSEYEIVKRSIHQTVLPKLTADDVDIFMNLQDCCFPNTTISLGTAHLTSELEKICTDMGYSANSAIIEKALQLASIQSTNHGIMLIGESGSGKTTVLKMTMKALMASEGVEHNSIVISPKVFSKEHLYGKFDSLTKQWTDGLFTSVLRRIQENSRGELDKRTWIVFDGDIDPVWAENLNSVLDDNRVLTLPTGERLVLPSCVSIVFETTNLNNATPATISRCGMIWFDRSLVTVNDLSSRLLFKLEHHGIRLDDESVLNKSQLSALTKDLIDCVVEVMMTPGLIDRLDTHSKQLEHIMHYSSERAISSLESLVISYVRGCLQMTVNSRIDSVNCKRYAGKLVILAVIWAFAGDCTSEERFQFEQQVKSFPDFAFVDFPRGNILDYEVGYPEADWIPIESKLAQLNLQPQEITNPNIIVPTVDTMKHEALIYSMIHEHRTLILCGPPGSGKTMTLFKALSQSSQFDILSLNFSKESTPRSLLDSMENFCEYRRVNGGTTLCPKTNGKWVVVFCDEINLPGLDKFGTQTVISLIRQMVEQNGFWRTKDMQWVNLRNIQFVGACNSPQDPGRYELNPNFLRHVCLVQVNYPENSSLLRIYQTLNEAIFKCAPNIKPFVNQITRASIDIYELSKSRLVQYVYSPRELTRWSRGLFEALKSMEYQHLTQFLRLWFNEGLRLFFDRLSNEEDKLWTLGLFQRVGADHFPNVDVYTCFKAPVFFTDWMTLRYQSINSQELKQFVKERLRVYSEEEIESDLVLHEEMLDHILRIDRVLKQPQGHCILVGPSSSGRTTLSRFVAWMNGIKVVQLGVKADYSIDDFDEFLRRLLLRVVDGEKLCLIIDESSIVEASFVERMNILLANAEVPGLFEGDNHATLTSKCLEKAQSQGLYLDTDSELTRWFTGQISQNLHVIFTIGESRKGKGDEVLSSPALFNRCVLSWMGDWSNNSLNSIASVKLSHLVLDSPPTTVTGETVGGDESYKDLVIDYLLYVHQNMSHLEFAHEMKYPGKFLKLIETFISLCDRKRSEADERQRHVIIGLEKLQETVLQVEKMKSFLASKEKALSEKNKEAREMLNQMLVDQNEAERKQEFSIETQAELERQESDILHRRETVLKELALVEPAVLEAQRGVQNIKKQHLTEIRSMSNPPAAVKMTMESVCVLLGYRVSSWRDVQLAIRGDDFIPNIVNFNCEYQLGPELREYMEQTYLSRADFTFEVAHRASKACGPLLEWVRAQLAYSSILKEVGPLREEVNALEQRTSKTKAHLIAIDQMITELETKIEQCKNSYSDLIRESEKIKMESDEVSQKLERSISLVENLENERARWKDSIKSFELENEQLVGTALLCASFVTYAGTLDEKGREYLLKLWKKRLSESYITYDERLSIVDYLMKKDEFQPWLECGLSDDELSKANVALLRLVEYPIVIDPTGTMVDLIAKSYPAKMITVTSFSNEGFLNSLENSLRFGGVLVLDDSEQYNPIVNDLLRNTIYRNGGRMMVELGGKLVDFNPGFKMIMCTKEPELELTDFVQSRASIINFSITNGSLENRILDNSLKVSHPELEKQRTGLILARSELISRLQSLEDELLMSLSASTENILVDDKLLDTLETLKKNSLELSKRLGNAKDVMSEVDEVREKYKGVADQSVAIHSLLSLFEKFSLFYRLPISGFLNLCVNVMKENDLSNLEAIALQMYRETYDVVSPSLAYEDKVALALLLVIMWNAIQKGKVFKDVVKLIMQHLLNPNPDKEFSIESILSRDQVAEINQPESDLEGMIAGPLSTLVESVNKPEAHLLESFGQFCKPLFHDIPFESRYSTEYWLENAQLIFAISPNGFDATSKIVEVAEMHNHKILVVSMGSKESSNAANKSIERAQKEPIWVIIQNVHLAPTWLGLLRSTLADHNFSPGSKLLLTCNSHSRLPQVLISKSKVLYFERVTLFRRTLLESFMVIPDRLLVSPVHLHVFLLLSWFHGCVFEMCRYTPFSFESKYEVNDSDFYCGISVIENAIQAAKGCADTIPWGEIRIMLGEVVYGGKISNLADQKYLQDLCNRIFTSKSLESSFNLIENELTTRNKEVLNMPDTNTTQAYLEWLENLPNEIPLSWLGLEENVKQSMTRKKSEEVTEKVLSLVDKV